MVLPSSSSWRSTCGYRDEGWKYSQSRMLQGAARGRVSWGSVASTRCSCDATMKLFCDGVRSR